MNRPSFFNVIVCSAFLSTGMGAAAYSQQMVTVAPEPSGQMLVNPGKGWSAFGSPDRHPQEVLDLVGMGVQRFDWARLEPQEGAYDWVPVETFLESWAKLGKVCNIGVMCASVHTGSPGGSATPLWVFEAGAKKIEVELDKALMSYSPVSGKRVAPVFDDPVFLEKFAQFLRAFAARYDGDPRIAVLDIRSYGNWGENHMHPFNKVMDAPDIAPEQFRKHIQMHVDAFRKTQLCIARNEGYLREIFDWAVLEHHVAPRRDGICGNLTAGRETAIGFGIAPGVFEMFGHYDFLKEKGWWIDPEGRKEPGYRLAGAIESGKPTWVDLGRGGEPGLRMLQENPELIARLTNRIGYHFLLKQAVYPDRAQQEHVSLELTWLNTGVAPIYVPCAVAVSLFDAADRRVATVWPDVCRPERWMPGEPVTETTRVQFTDVPPGTYRLTLAITRNNGDTAPYIALGSALPVIDGWYVLGDIVMER